MRPLSHKKTLVLDSPKGSTIQEINQQVKQKPPWDWRVVGQATELGFSLALPIALGALFGLWMDKRFMSRPKLTVTFLSLGIILAFTRLYQIVKDYSRKER